MARAKRTKIEEEPVIEEPQVEAVEEPVEFTTEEIEAAIEELDASPDGRDEAIAQLDALEVERAEEPEEMETVAANFVPEIVTLEPPSPVDRGELYIETHPILGVTRRARVVSNSIGDGRVGDGAEIVRS